MKIEYDIFVSASPNLLVTLVDAALSVGWELQGGVAGVTFADGDTYFYQAMFRNLTKPDDER